jgi:uroporphyrinogen decarboxylase
MTSRERVIAALKRQEPDRVPTFEWIINPNVMEKMTGQRDEIEFINLMGIDGIAINPNMQNVIIDSRHFKDEWGIVRVSYDEYPNPVGYPVSDESDLKSLTVPDPDAEYRFDSIKNAKKVMGDEKAIIIRLRDVFSQPRDLMGFEDFMVSFYTQPDLVERLMEISVDYNTRLAKNAREMGGEIIVVGDDIANNSGLLINPEQYRSMVLPHFKKLIQNFKSMGFLVIKHTDGNIMAVLEDLIDTGIDCIDPIDPLGHMDIEFIKKTYGNRVCIKGNIDCVRTLVDKTPQDVVRATKDCILKASIGGGHIISSSNSIHSGINSINYRVFLESIKEYGTYPLDIQRLKAI